MRGVQSAVRGAVQGAVQTVVATASSNLDWNWQFFAMVTYGFHVGKHE